MLSDFFLTDLHSSAIALEYSHNYWLVGLSFLIAVFASYTAFTTLQQVIVAPNQGARLTWLATGAVTMGCGIWAMHFVAMLAVRMDADVRYEPLLTILSLVFAILASGFAFDFVAKGARAIQRLIVAGAVLGGGIGLMHYAGMLAMRTQAAIRFEPLLFGISIVVAVALATLVLRLMFFSAEKRTTANPAILLATAAVMGLSITLMHYTGMSATQFLVLHAEPRAVQGIALNGWLVQAAIGGVALAITGLTLSSANKATAQEQGYGSAAKPEPVGSVRRHGADGHFHVR